MLDELQNIKDCEIIKNLLKNLSYDSILKRIQEYFENLQNQILR